MVGGRKEQGAWGPQVVAAGELGFGSCGGSFVEGTGEEEDEERQEEEGRRGKENSFLFFLFVVDVERNKQSCRGRGNICFL